jgi:ClpP class serine protease
VTDNVSRERLIQGVKLLSRSPYWAILPSVLPAFMLGVFKAEHPAWECAKPRTEGRGQNRIGVIPIQGILSKDGPSYWGTNYDTIADVAERAADDPTVRKIVLAVDSPGGEVTGLPETARVLAQVAKVG